MASSATGNIFAALAKTRSKKEKKPKAESDAVPDKHAELEAAIFSQSGTGLSNWADDSEEDDEWQAQPAEAQGEGWSEVSDHAGAIAHPGGRALPCWAPHDLHLHDAG
jgi:hypothetical protein